MHSFSWCSSFWEKKKQISEMAARVAVARFLARGHEFSWCQNNGHLSHQLCLYWHHFYSSGSIIRVGPKWYFIFAISCPKASPSLKAQKFLNQALYAHGVKKSAKWRLSFCTEHYCPEEQMWGVCGPREHNLHLEILPREWQETRAGPFLAVQPGMANDSYFLGPSLP